MLPEENRLRLKRDHDLIFRKGLRFKSPFFLLLVLKRTDTTLPSRFSFVVSKKVDKRAVVRNQIRRRLRELVRKNLDSINSGFDCIFIASPNAAGKKTKTMLPYFEKTLRNARMINQNANLKKQNDTKVNCLM